MEMNKKHIQVGDLVDDCLYLQEPYSKDDYIGMGIVLEIHEADFHESDYVDVEDEVTDKWSSDTTWYTVYIRGRELFLPSHSVVKVC